MPSRPGPALMLRDVAMHISYSLAEHKMYTQNSKAMFVGYIKRHTHKKNIYNI